LIESEASEIQNLVPYQNTSVVVNFDFDNLLATAQGSFDQSCHLTTQLTDKEKYQYWHYHCIPDESIQLCAQRTGKLGPYAFKGVSYINFLGCATVVDKVGDCIAIAFYFLHKFKVAEMKVEVNQEF
jgi:hypothetical protein